MAYSPGLSKKDESRHRTNPDGKNRDRSPDDIYAITEFLNNVPVERRVHDAVSQVAVLQRRPTGGCPINPLFDSRFGVEQ